MPNDPVQVMLLGDGAEHAEIGVIVWNAERRYVAANPKACELVGTTREQLLASTVGSTNRSPEGVFWDWPGDTEIVLARKRQRSG